MASVFGVPGYSLYEEDYIPNEYLPDITIKTQEQVRHAMLSGDYDFVDEMALKLQLILEEDHSKTSLIQIKNYLICWSFYKQGAEHKSILDKLLECIRLTRPGFVIDVDIRDIQSDIPLTYTEISIINAIGVILIQVGDYSRANHLFGILIRKSDSEMLNSERRFFRKFILGLNMALSLRKSGCLHDARSLLKVYIKDVYLYGTAAICLKFLTALYRCLDKHSDDYVRERRYAAMFHRIMAFKFGLKKSMAQIERECDEGIMCL